MPHRFPFKFDWKNPNYNEVILWRIDRLNWIRANPKELPALKAYYRENIADFITDWGMTYDPRNVERKLPARIPFILFPRQRDLVQWIIDRWRAQEPGLIEKSRDMGVSWETIAAGCSFCLFYDDLALGFGSRKQEYVDKIGHPKALFWKAREFMKMIPEEFSGKWNEDKHSALLRIDFPLTRSVMTGEAGDNIGRGDRASIYFVDEAAYIERPELVDAALSNTTNCRIDLSSVNGSANSFAEKRQSYPEHQVFIFDWRDDPRKDQTWYDKMCLILPPVIVAQEIDRNYNASVENVIIPGEWVQSAIDAHLKLGIVPSGIRTAGLDVADEGRDKNALAARTGILLTELEEWSGKQGDIFHTTVKAFHHLSNWQVFEMLYDADGLGAGVRGDARVMNEARIANDIRPISIVKFQGSGAVTEPSREMIEGRKNLDFFQNFKAQSWWSLRRRFEITHKAIHEGTPYKPDEIISISSSLRGLSRLTIELSQPVYLINSSGKMVVDKQPDGMKSPNLADAVMIAYSPVKRPFKPQTKKIIQSMHRK